MLKFVFIKFAALGLSSMRSLLLASFLGPASYGALGVLILIQQYLSYAALGMREGLSVSLSNSLNGPHDAIRICSSALTWGAGVGFFIAFCIVSFYSIGLLSYNLVWVAIISFLSILNEILININRAEDKLLKVALVELSYNSIPMVALLYFWRSITIYEVLSSLAIGLLVSVLIYLWTLPGVNAKHASWTTTKQMLVIGFPLSIQSALIFAANSIFVILAERMNQESELGIVLLAGNICALIMFALNAVAWASTNRSMRLVNSANVKSTEYLRASRVRNIFQVGIVVAVIFAMMTKLIFWFVLEVYSGADEFIIYFVLFQAYGLLMFDDLNYLAVKGRYRLIIAAYFTLLLMTIATATVLPISEFSSVVKIGIALHFTLAMVITVYCKKLRGTQVVGIGSNYVFLMFPIACMILYSAAGHVGLALVCALAALLKLRDWFATR